MSSPTPGPGSYRLIGPTEDVTSSDILASLDAQASGLRLQALIAEWLRMENLVVLTGAGTSVSSGGQTMATLEQKVLSVVKAVKGISAEILKIIEIREGANHTLPQPFPNLVERSRTRINQLNFDI